VDRLIIEFLKKELGYDLDRELTTEQRAIGRAFQTLVEENLYFMGLWHRWQVEQY
jgi:hypothetical protein